MEFPTILASEISGSGISYYFQLLKIAVVKFPHLWQQKNQYWSLFVGWIFKNPIFHWYWHYFCQRLLKTADVTFLKTGGWNSNDHYSKWPVATIIQENPQSFYPSEPFRIIHFTMRHPVPKCRQSQEHRRRRSSSSSKLPAQHSWEAQACHQHQCLTLRAKVVNFKPDKLRGKW